MHSGRVFSLSILGLACCLACGKSTPTPATKDPPVVVVTLPQTNVVGTALKLNVGVNGCETVSNLTVLEHDQAIKSVPFTANPTEVDLTKDDLTFRELAGHFTFSAKATCKDGRSSTSQKVSATFLPVQAVFSNADGSSVVPVYFSAEGSGASVSFVGCASDGQNGTYLVRVSASGALLAQSAPLPVTCTYSTWFSDPSIDGSRWMMTPGFGALAFDSSLNITGAAVDATGQLLPVSLIGVGPDGDAVVVASLPSSTQDFFRIAKDNCSTGTCAPPVWSAQFADGYVPQGNPIVLSLAQNEIEIPTDTFDLSGGNADYYVERWVYGTSGTANGGDFVGRTHLTYVQVPQFQSPVHLPVAFSTDGSLAYVPFQTSTTESSLVAFSTSVDDTAQWQATGLAGDVFSAVPFGPGGTFVAAIGWPNTFFRNGGTVLGPPLSATGTLVPVAYVTGRDGSGNPDQSFFLFNGPTSGSFSGLPEQILAVDKPSNGLLFEFDIGSGSLSAAVDDSGQVWMRVGANLYQLLPLSEYRALLGG